MTDRPEKVSPVDSSTITSKVEGQALTLRKKCDAPAPLVVNGFPYAGCSEDEGHYPGTQHKFTLTWG